MGRCARSAGCDRGAEENVLNESTSSEMIRGERREGQAVQRVVIVVQEAVSIITVIGVEIQPALAWRGEAMQDNHRNHYSFKAYRRTDVW